MPGASACDRVTVTSDSKRVADKSCMVPFWFPRFSLDRVGMPMVRGKARTKAKASSKFIHFWGWHGLHQQGTWTPSDLCRKAGNRSGLAECSSSCEPVFARLLHMRRAAGLVRAEDESATLISHRALPKPPGPYLPRSHGSVPPLEMARLQEDGRRGILH